VTASVTEVEAAESLLKSSGALVGSLMRSRVTVLMAAPKITNRAGETWLPVFPRIRNVAIRGAKPPKIATREAIADGRAP